MVIIHSLASCHIFLKEIEAAQGQTYLFLNLFQFIIIEQNLLYMSGVEFGIHLLIRNYTSPRRFSHNQRRVRVGRKPAIYYINILKMKQYK